MPSEAVGYSPGLGMGPSSGGVIFAPREILKTPQSVRPASRASRGSYEFGQSRNSLRSSLPASLPSRAVSSPQKSHNEKLSSVEIENLLREKIKTNYHDLKQACQNYDIDQSLTITKGELRRVIDSFCQPLTTEQFESVVAKVPVNANGTVNYCMFLDRFASTGGGSKESWKMASGHRYSYTKSPHDMGTDVLERQLRKTIGANAKNFLRSLRLFDYNRDGRIQKHEMRKVIENYCFRMTDEQYDKFWARYDFHHSGHVNYHDFLQRLGVNVQRHDKTFPESAKFVQSPDEKANDRAIDIEKMAIVNRSDDVVKGLNYDQIEAELRKRLKDNYVNLRKAFMAFDARRDGFVTLEDLKSILIHFTLPMSDQLFSQIMDRLGLKASHKIAWEHFLEKFQDPRTVGNGQTIPIKPNHKFNLIREADTPLSIEDILRLLHKHVTTMYTSIKQAFLAFDENREGKVTHNKLRKILDKFTIRLSDEQFQGLIKHLDPDNENAIDYHAFLDTFEVRETEEGHKWLNSEHRWNTNLAPANMAWETIEDILREKIEEYWKSISPSLRAADPGGTGKIGHSQLKRIIAKHVLPVSDEHFDKLWYQCEETPEGKVFIQEFLGKLGVDVSPGDLVGPSTLIHAVSDLTEQGRLIDLDSRLHRVQKLALHHTNQLSAEEVLVKLKDRMSQKSSSIRDNFLRYCKNRKGRLSRKEFRQVLETFGMFMSDEQFNKLCERVGFVKPGLTYTDFIAGFEDLRKDGPGNEIQRFPNHWWKQLDSKTMSSNEMIGVFADKLRQTYGDLRSAFYKMDDDHDGIVRRQDFRLLLDTLMLISSDDEFNNLMDYMEIYRKSKLTYLDFLDKFQARDTEEGHKWLDSDHRYNTTIDPAQMAADQVHEILVTKAQRQYHDLAKAFRSIDKNGNGVIQKKELRDMLFTFMLPMTKEEFSKLWTRYDPNKKGFIDHQHFLRMMGKSFAPSDGDGISRRIVDGSLDTIEQHHKNQLEKQINITLSQATNSSYISAAKLEQALKDRFRDKYGTFQEAFAQIDQTKTGYISVKELSKVLVDHNYLVDDNTLKVLLRRIGLSTEKSKLSYEQFLRAFDEGQEEQYRQRDVPDIQVETFSQLLPDKAVKKLRKMVQGNVSVLQSAFGAFDKEKTGRIGSSEFRRVLDNFCFKLTEKQFKILLTKVKVNPDLSINYPAFLDEFSANEQELAQNWIASIQKAEQELEGNPTRTSPSLYEIQDEVKQQVSAHFNKFADRFSEIDYADIGVISKEDFREVLDQLAVRLSYKQFEELWTTLDINEFNNLEYHKFLKQFTSDIPPPSLREPITLRPTSAQLLQPPRTAERSISASPRVGSRMSLFSGAGRRLATPLVNAENIELKLKRYITRFWQDILRMCKNRDFVGSGEISMRDFQSILEECNCYLPPDEFCKLMTKYDLNESGKFSYLEFLKHFVLNMRTINEENEPRSLLSRQKIHPAKVPVKSGEIISPDMLEAMLRVRKCVANNWKKMRREFRLIDPSALGIINTLQFRNILRQFSINLSENEFFHLMTYYDKDLEGKISYNDFLRAFLQ